MSPVTFKVLDKPTHAWVVCKTGTRTLLGYVWRNAKGWWSHVGDGHRVEGPFKDRLEAGEFLLNGRKVNAAS